MKSLYMQAEPAVIAPYVIFSGDPWRVDVLAKNLTAARQIAFAREFNTYTGTYHGVPVTVSSTGIGAPSAAIGVEEMYENGMEVAVRMGTAMGLRDDMLGRMFIPTACMRDEATSATYVRRSYPAVADFELVGCMSRASRAVGREVVTGINCTMDGFYSRMKDSRLSREQGNDHAPVFSELKKLKVLGADMESSCILTLTNLMGIKGCVVTMTTVLENLRDFLKGEERTRSEEDLCLAVLEGLVLYHNENGKKEKGEEAR